LLFKAFEVLRSAIRSADEQCIELRNAARELLALNVVLDASRGQQALQISERAAFLVRAKLRIGELPILLLEERLRFLAHWSALGMQKAYPLNPEHADVVRRMPGFSRIWRWRC